jgi:hypothetical protein
MFTTQISLAMKHAAKQLPFFAFRMLRIWRCHVLREIFPLTTFLRLLKFSATPCILTDLFASTLRLNWVFVGIFLPPHSDSEAVQIQTAFLQKTGRRAGVGCAALAFSLQQHLTETG